MKRVHEVIGIKLNEYMALEKLILPKFKAGTTIEGALEKSFAIVSDHRNLTPKEKTVFSAGFICGVLTTRNEVKNKFGLK